MLYAYNSLIPLLIFYILLSYCFCVVSFVLVLLARESWGELGFLYFLH